MAEHNIALFDRPAPGQGLTAEVNGRPWQNPYQYSTIAEVIDYYVPRLADDDISDQLVDLMEMGVPLTTIANGMQLSAVMEGVHSIDLGMLVMPILVEMMQLIGDSANVEYVTGMEKADKPRESLVQKAIAKFREEEEKQEEEPEEPTVVVATVEEKPVGGLMSRS